MCYHYILVRIVKMKKKKSNNTKSKDMRKFDFPYVANKNVKGYIHSGK